MFSYQRVTQPQKGHHSPMSAPPLSFHDKWKTSDPVNGSQNGDVVIAVEVDEASETITDQNDETRTLIEKQGDAFHNELFYPSDEGYGDTASTLSNDWRLLPLDGVPSTGAGEFPVTASSSGTTLKDSRLSNHSKLYNRLNNSCETSPRVVDSGGLMTKRSMSVSDSGFLLSSSTSLWPSKHVTSYAIKPVSFTAGDCSDDPTVYHNDSSSPPYAPRGASFYIDKAVKRHSGGSMSARELRRRSPYQFGHGRHLQAYSSRVNRQSLYTDSVSGGISVDRQTSKELWKVVLTFIYMFLVMGFHSFVLVLAHERVPAHQPPLPDLVLDALPLLPWAFKAAETFLVVLLFIFLLVAFFHKHRLVILRRAFALMGTAYLLRSLTAVATSLSVPNLKLTDACAPLQITSMQERLSRAFRIWLGFGMSIQGVQTCGDYMFSGHACSLTLLNFFITEYTPSSFYPLHIVTWIMNVTGMVFILAAKEHYTIDVIIAFYISSRLFHYYHSLANNTSLILHRPGSSEYQRWRTRLCFPILLLLESNSRGPVPNEYHVPFINRILPHRHAFS